MPQRRKRAAPPPRAKGLTPSQVDALERKILEGHQTSAAALQQLLMARRTAEEPALSEDVADFLRELIDGMETFASLAERATELLGNKKKAKASAAKANAKHKVPPRVGDNALGPYSGHNKQMRKDIVFEAADAMFARKEMVSAAEMAVEAQHSKLNVKLAAQCGLSFDPRAWATILRSNPKYAFHRVGRLWSHVPVEDRKQVAE